MTTKRYLNVTVTFVGAAAPAVLDTADHKFKHYFAAAVTFVDATRLGRWLQLRGPLGVATEPETATLNTYAVGGTWDNGERWDLSEDL
jgi:hypothetical protein